MERPGPRPALRLAALALVPLLVGPAVVTTSPTRAGARADTGGEPAAAAATWLAGELASDGTVRGPGGRVDHGLGADVLLGLAAARTGRSTAAGIVGALDDDLGSWIGPDLYRKADARMAGATAKALFVVAVAGEDPHAFGRSSYLSEGERYDLRREVLDLVAHDGPRAGRIANRATGRDDTNVFAQAFAVMGLHRTGGAPESSIRYLLTQQCTGGWFRMYFNDALTCDEARAVGDGDGTAMALDALLGVRRSMTDRALRRKVDDAVRRAAGWLLSVQGTDGAFGGSGATATGNANSTALVAQALAAVASDTEELAPRAGAGAERARAWLHEHQVQARRSADARLVAAGESGAVAYSTSALVSARETGIGDHARDQWRRSTAQALLGLGEVPFAELDLTEVREEVTPGPRPAPSAGATPVLDEASPSSSPTGPATTPGPGKPKATTRQRPSAGPVPALPRSTTAAPLPAATPAPASVPGIAEVDPDVGRLLGRLTQGTHVRTSVDGVEYVDHAATVDVLLTLHALDAPASVTRPITQFLLHDDQVSAWAHASAAEQGASYALPLARLVLAAALSDRPADRTRAADLRSDLAPLVHDGRVVDQGQTPDREDDAERLAWVTLALETGDPELAADVREHLVDLTCTNGGWGRTTPCAEPDAPATAAVLQALMLRSTPDRTVEAAQTPAVRRALAMLGEGTLQHISEQTATGMAVLAAGRVPASLTLADQQAAELTPSALATAVSVARRRGWWDSATSPLTRTELVDVQQQTAQTGTLGWAGLGAGGLAGLCAGVLLTWAGVRARRRVVDPVPPTADVDLRGGSR